MNADGAQSVRLREALDAAFADEPPSLQRLSYAQTTVGFRVDGDEDQSVTLMLDRTPPEVAGPDEEAEIELELSPEQAARLAVGRLPISSAALAGEVKFRGPLRKYLEVDPILRGLLAKVSASGSEEPEDHESSPSAHRSTPEELDSELLAIETRELHKSFGSNQILTGLDLRVPEGTISVVLGPSGTGKSVLLQHIIGLMRPDSGEVLVWGRCIGEMSRRELHSVRPDIGVMFQDGALFSDMNVYDNVAFPLRQHTDFKESEVREIVGTRLRSLGLEQADELFPGNLSGGMRKRAGLARALVLDPRIVLCGEPDSGLDPVRTALLADLLASEHAESGGTMVVVTHNIELAKRVGDYISVLAGGKVIESGTRDEVVDSDHEFVQQFLAGETEGPLDMDDG